MKLVVRWYARFYVHEPPSLTLQVRWSRVSEFLHVLVFAPLSANLGGLSAENCGNGDRHLMW